MANPTMLLIYVPESISMFQYPNFWICSWGFFYVDKCDITDLGSIDEKFPENYKGSLYSLSLW